MQALRVKKTETRLAARDRCYFRIRFLKRFSVSSLRVRLLLIVAGAIVPALGLMLYDASEHRRLDAIEVQENALRLARLASANQERVFEAAQQVLTLLSELPEIRRQDSKGCNERSGEFLKKFPLYANFGAIKTNGDIFCSALPTKGLINVADRVYFQNALKKRSFAVGEYQIGRIHGKPAVNFGYPVLGDNGAVSAVVFASLDLAWLNQFVAKAELPDGATLKVIDHNGTILVRHPDPEKWVGKPTSGDILKTVLSQREGVGESPAVDGAPSLFAFSPLGGTKDFAHLHIVVGIPKSVAFAEANRIVKENLSALGIVAILALFAAWYGGNLFILGPVTALMNATKRLSLGELSARTGLPHGGGELGQLARSFDGMAESLERRHLELRALREIDLAITSTLDPGAVLNILLQKIDLVLPYAATTVRLFNKQSGLLEPVACHNLDEKEWKAEQWKGGRGTPNVAFETKAPVMASNVQTDPRVRDPEFFRRHGLVSYLGIPLIVQDDVLGVISFYTKEEHEFTDEEVELLTALASQAAIAIYNSRLYEQVKSRAMENTLLLEEVRGKTLQLEDTNRQLSILNSLTAEVSRSLDLDHVLCTSVDRVLEIFNFDAGRIYLVDDSHEELCLVASKGFAEELLPRAYKPGEGVIGKVFMTGEPFYFKDIQNDPEFVRLARRKRILSAGYRAQFYIPIQVKGKVLGVMSFASKSVHEFSPNEAGLVRSIADQIGIAVDNAALFAQVNRKTDELEKANKVKDEFLSVMSHELRTPLNVVMGYTGMIRDGMLGEVNQQQQEALGKVIGRAKDLLDMINEILQTTSIEAKAVKAEPHEVDLGEFLNNLKSNYEYSLNKKVSLVWDYPSDLPLVQTDSEKLKHVFQNLVNNAIKFTPKGHVTITARYLEGEKTLEFRVADTGIGIAKEGLPLIFERFRQVDSSETRLYGGVGMGLYIVKKFTELLGGKVHVESELGKGSVFTVLIPCQ